MLGTGVRLFYHNRWSLLFPTKEYTLFSDKWIVLFPNKEYILLIMSKLTLLHWQLYTESLTGIIKK